MCVHYSLCSFLLSFLSFPFLVSFSCPFSHKFFLTPFLCFLCPYFYPSWGFSFLSSLLSCCLASIPFLCPSSLLSPFFPSICISFLSCFLPLTPFCILLFFLPEVHSPLLPCVLFPCFPRHHIPYSGSICKPCLLFLQGLTNNEHKVLCYYFVNTNLTGQQLLASGLCDTADVRPSSGGLPQSCCEDLNTIVK